jgi:hypothetical protein
MIKKILIVNILEDIMNNFDSEIKRLKREIADLEQQKGQLPRYSYSKIRLKDLDELFNIEEKLSNGEFSEWLDNNIVIEENDIIILEKLIDKNRRLIHKYSEEDLKIHFLSPLFLLVDFKSIDNGFRDFYNEKITYKSDKFIFNGEVDFVLSLGLLKSKTPYFFIQEFKKGVEFSDPLPQLLAEMIAGLELTKVDEFKGAYIIGAIWNFVLLQKLDKDKYQYFVSENFDSSKIGDLIEIYKNLSYIKNSVIKEIKLRDNLV